MRTALFIALLCLVLATPAQAAASFEVSGWIPYWAVAKGTRSAEKNLDALSVIMPFSFSIERDGDLKDLGKMKKTSWKRLFSKARKEGVLIVPTVMASDGALVHELLSDAKKRKSHIHHIVEMVEDGKYDGVDIDYEGKRASTRPYFAAFLGELKDALGDAMLSCTIEARTPPEDLYRTVPLDLQYANDFEAINEHCDRVNIMAYDQQRADLSLNDARKGAPYIPISDLAWVKKVVELTAKTIDKDKLVLGVATYGAEWELAVEPDWYKSYQKLWAFNPSYARDMERKHKVDAGTNSAGEQSFTYLPKSSKKTVGAYPVPKGTPKGNEAAAQALAYANDTGKATIVHILWWSDANAIREKVEFAKQFGLQGVAIFKIDGGEDKGLWRAF